MSFENLLLYSKAVAVNYDTDEDGEGEDAREWRPELDANDPNNSFTEGSVRR